MSRTFCPSAKTEFHYKISLTYKTPFRILSSRKSNFLSIQLGKASEELLNRPDVDVVDICVPPSLHHPFAIKAAEAGKHLIMEKPLTGYFQG